MSIFQHIIADARLTAADVSLQNTAANMPPETMQTELPQSHESPSLEQGQNVAPPAAQAAPATMQPDVPDPGPLVRSTSSDAHRNHESPDSVNQQQLEVGLNASEQTGGISALAGKSLAPAPTEQRSTAPIPAAPQNDNRNTSEMFTSNADSPSQIDFSNPDKTDEVTAAQSQMSFPGNEMHQPGADPKDVRGMSDKARHGKQNGPHSKSDAWQQVSQEQQPESRFDPEHSAHASVAAGQGMSEQTSAGDVETNSPLPPSPTEPLAEISPTIDADTSHRSLPNQDNQPAAADSQHLDPLQYLARFDLMRNQPQPEQPAGNQLHIGQVNVVVESAPATTAVTRSPSLASDNASRLFLRSL